MKASDFVKKKSKTSDKGKKMNLMDWIGKRRGSKKDNKSDDDEC